MKTISGYYKVAVLFGALFLTGNKIYAQYDAMFTQYMFNEMFINPGYAGSKEALAVTALHRQQWVSFPGRPITTTFAVHGPLAGNKMGIGLSLLNEKIGVLQRNMVNLNYAYRVKTGDRGYLSLGVMGGIQTQAANFATLQNIVNSQDPQLTNNTPNVVSLNYGVGLYYYSKTFYCGLSVPRMVNDNVHIMANGKTDKSLNFSPAKFHYYFTIGKVFEISDELKIKPEMMVKVVQNAPIEIDPNVNFLLHDKVWLGASYRSYSDVSFLLGYQLNTQFLASLAYDVPVTRIQKYTAGSFEIALSYVFGFRNKKLASPRYF